MNPGAKKKPFNWIAVLLFIMGAVFFAASLYGYRQHQYIKKNGVETEGRVSRVEQKVTRGSDGEKKTETTMYVTFTTTSGQEIEFKSDYSNSSAARGDMYKVYYMPDNPHNAKVGSTGKTIMMFLFMGISALLLLVSGRMLFGGARRARFKDPKNSFPVAAEVVEIKQEDAIDIPGRGIVRYDVVLKTEDGRTFDQILLNRPDVAVGHKATVYISIKNPQKYRIEI